MSTLLPNVIQISRPAPKAISEVQVPPKAYLNFLFSLQGADSSKQGDDLVIELPDGSKVICLGYYSNTAEGDRPQIAVNGEALPPSDLDVQFFNQQVEGVRVDGAPQGTEQSAQGEQGAQNAGDVAGQEAGADGKSPASSGATATGESANTGQGAEQATGQAGQVGQAGQGSSTSASNSGSSSGSSSGSHTNEGGLKLDHNVDFLGGINRLPGLDLGSDRGFDRTDIEGGPIWTGDTSTTPSPPPPAPSAPPVGPPVAPPPKIFEQISGLKEEGKDVNGNVTTAGTDSASRTITVRVPDGVDPTDITLDFSLFPGAPSGVLTPGTTYDTSYGKFSYTVTPNQVPVLNADGTPMLDAGGNPVMRWEVDIDVNYGGLDNTNSTINALPDGAKLNEDMSFTITGKNPDGSKATIGSGDVSFVIEGSNDGPKLTKSGSNLAGHGEVKEEGVYNDNKLTQDGEWDSYQPSTPSTGADYGTHKDTTTVQLGATDADASDSLTFSLTNTNVDITGVNAGRGTLVQNANGSYTLMIGTEACGTLTLSASGALSFTLDSTSSLIQAMKAGQFSELKLNVTVTDKGGLTDTGDVTLTIHGTNDRPSFTVPAGGIDIVESGDNVNHTRVTGQLQGTDPEGSNTEFYIAKDATVAGKDKLDSGDALGSMDGQYGTLVLNPDGSYTYTENGSLRAGETRQDTFTVLVKDDKGAFTTKEITFNVEGKNNQVTFPIQSGDNYVISMVEEGVLTGGNNPNDATSPGDMQAKIIADGNITKLPSGNDFIVDDDASGGPGVANGRTFGLTKSAGSASDLVIKSTTSPDGAGWQTIETEYGYFKFNIYTGDYSYSLKKDVGYLTKDDNKTEIFTVTVYKGGVSQGGRDFSVTISGMNDMPEFGPVQNLVVTAQGSANTGILTADSTATSTDVDSGDTHIYSIEKTNPDGSVLLIQTIKGTYGTLELDPVSGLYTYTLDNERAATKALGQNQKGEEKFTFRVVDAAGAYDTIEVTVTVNGAYDKPVISYGGETIAEDSPTADRTVDGDISISTTDAVHSGSKSFTLVNADGSIPAKDVNGMQIITTAYGTLEFNTLTGQYTYTLSEAGNALLQKENIGDTINQDFTVRVTFPEAGGATSTVDTTINVDLAGVNDNPYFTADSQTSITMDRVFLWEKNEGIVDKVVAEDIDNKSLAGGGTDLTFYFKGAGGEILYTIETSYGRVSINPKTGEYTYTLDPNNAYVKRLDKGHSLNDAFNVTVRDPHGGEAEQKIDVTINGKDVPAGGGDGFILPTDDLHVKEDGDGSGSTNPGQEDNSSPSPSGTGVRYCFEDATGKMTQSIKGAYGDIYIDAYTGQYRYVLNNQLLSVQQMMQGVKALENFVVYGFTIDPVTKQPIWVTNPDGTPKVGDIKVTVEGTNDDPVLTHTVTANGLTVYAGTPSGGNSIKTGGVFEATDVDNGDTKTFGLSTGEPQTNPADCTILTLTDGTTTWGTVTIGTDGKYEFTYNPQKFTGTKTLTFWVYVKDSTGAIDKEEVTITITTANTKPVIISCTYTDESGNSTSYAYNNTGTPHLGIDHTTGNVQLGNADLTQGMQSALVAGMKESTTTLKGSFGSWDNEVAHGVQSPSGYTYFLKVGTEYENLHIHDYGSLNLSRAGSFTFTLNNQSEMVKALQQGQSKTLTYTVVVRDANGAYSGEQSFEIVITGTNNKPEITATQRLITMTESGDVLDDMGNILTGTPKFELKVDDADLYRTDGNGNVIDKSVQAGHNFELNGTGTGKGGSTLGDLAITGGKQSDGSSYVFTVGDGTNIYGTFHIKVNPLDAADVTYWFEVNPSMKDYLTQNDNVTLNFKVKFNDGSMDNSVNVGMSNETSVNVAIKGENSVPDIAPADTQITLAEDGTDTKHDLTITDSDLGADIKKYDFDLVGKGTTEIGREIKSAAGSEYSFEVKQGNVLYGKLHMEVNPADPKNVKYWFEVDGSVKDILFNNDKIDLNFDIVFKDEYGGASTGQNISVTINGAGAAPPITTTTVLDADILPDTQDPAQAQTVQSSVDVLGNAAAPDTAPDTVPDTVLAEASATPLVAALAAPDIVLPGMDFGLLIGTQDGQGTMHTQQGQGANTLETPLPEAPTPDLTSAPGQEALQFQLQTTGL